MKRHPRRLPAALLCATALLGVSGCSQLADKTAAPTGTTAAPSAATDAELQRAKTAAQAFSGQLRAKLQAAMGEGGPVAAVDVCHAEAPRIADAVMAEHGVRLGRVALPGRNRNAGQAADDWRLATLEQFQQAVDQGAAAAEQVSVQRKDLPEGIALRMMRGIATEPGCLACHGSTVAPAVRDAIARHYPGDAATGFDVGDLRGALWVEVPLAQEQGLK